MGPMNSLLLVPNSEHEVLTSLSCCTHFLSLQSGAIQWCILVRGRKTLIRTKQIKPFYIEINPGWSIFLGAILSLLYLGMNTIDHYQYYYEHNTQLLLLLLLLSYAAESTNFETQTKTLIVSQRIKLQEKENHNLLVNKDNKVAEWRPINKEKLRLFIILCSSLHCYSDFLVCSHNHFVCLPSCHRGLGTL